MSDELLSDINFDENLIDITETGEDIESSSTEETLEIEKKTTKTTDADKDTSSLEAHLIDLADPDSDDITSDGKSSSSDAFSSIVAALGSEGFIDIEDEELEGIEDYAQFLRDKLNSAVENKAKSKLTERQLSALEAFEKGVPIEEYVNSNAREVQYSNLDEDIIKEKTDLQKELVYRSLTAQGLSDSKARELIDLYESQGEEKLVTESLSAKEDLVKREQAYRKEMQIKAEAERAKQEEQIEKELNKVETFVKEQKEIIPGLELSAKMKEKVLNNMTKPIDRADDGTPISAAAAKRAKDPVRFDMLMNYYLELGLFNEEPDFTIFKKLGHKKAASGLDKLLNGDTTFLTAGGSKSKGSLSSDEDDLGLGAIDW